MKWFLGASWVGLSLAWEQDSAALVQVWRVMCRMDRTHPNSASQLEKRPDFSKYVPLVAIPQSLAVPSHQISIYPLYSHLLFACLKNQLAWKPGILAETSRSQLHQTVSVCCDKSSKSGAPGHWHNILGTSFLEKKLGPAPTIVTSMPTLKGEWDVLNTNFWKFTPTVLFIKIKVCCLDELRHLSSPCGDHPAASSTWDLLESPVCRPAKLKLE